MRDMTGTVSPARTSMNVLNSLMIVTSMRRARTRMARSRALAMRALLETVSVTRDVWPSEIKA